MSDASSYSSSYGSGEKFDDDGKLEGLTVVEALLLTAILVMASFAVSLVSMDLEREETYHELEEAAKGERKPELAHYRPAVAKKTEEEHATEVIAKLKLLRGNSKFGGGGLGGKPAPFGGFKTAAPSTVKVAPAPMKVADEGVPQAKITDAEKLADASLAAAKS